MNPFTKLDSLLLSCAQWVVDRIGGDYIGQRIGRQLGYMAATGIIISYAIDYRLTGVFLLFCLVIWTLNIPVIYSYAKRASDSIYRGFMNPLRERVDLRVFLVGCAVLIVTAPNSLGWIDVINKVSFCSHVVAFYLLSTDNPPPKKVKETKKEDVSLLAPVEIPS